MPRNAGFWHVGLLNVALLRISWQIPQFHKLIPYSHHISFLTIPPQLQSIPQPRRQSVRSSSKASSRLVLFFCMVKRQSRRFCPAYYDSVYLNQIYVTQCRWWRLKCYLPNLMELMLTNCFCIEMVVENVKVHVVGMVTQLMRLLMFSVWSLFTVDLRP